MFPLLNCCLFLVPQDVIWSCCDIPTLSNTCIIIKLLFCFSFLLYFQSHPSTEFSQKGQLNDAHRTLLRATVAVFVNYFTSQCIYYMLACTFRLFCNFMFYLLFYRTICGRRPLSSCSHQRGAYCILLMRCCPMVCTLDLNQLFNQSIHSFPYSLFLRCFGRVYICRLDLS